MLKQRANLIIFSLTCCAAFALCFWYGQHRFLAGDEGFYLFAASQVAGDRVPYIDFFYPQMPLLPYLIALPSLLGGGDVTWDQGRFIVAILNTLIAVLIFFLAASRAQKIIAGVFSVIVFLGTDLVPGFLVLVKTYSPACCLLLLAFTFLRFSKNRSLFFFLGGLCFSGSVLCRLPFLVVFPLLLVETWQVSKEFRKKQLFLFSGGFLIGLTPVLWFLIQSSETFLFNNLEYHALRNRRGLIGGFHQKWEILSELVTMKRDHGYITWQIVALFVTSLFGGWVFWKRYRQVDICTMLGITLFGVSLLPTPVYPQYFTVAAPFFIPAAVQLLICISTRLSESKGVLFSLFLLGLFLWPFPQQLRRYTESGVKVPGIFRSKNTSFWTSEHLAQVNNTLMELTDEGEEVLSTWPGYLVGTGLQAVHGAENHFSLPIAKKLTVDQQKNFSILGNKEIKTLIEQRQVRTLIYGYRREHWPRKNFLEINGYQAVAQVGNVEVFQVSR